MCISKYRIAAIEIASMIADESTYSHRWHVMVQFAMILQLWMSGFKQMSNQSKVSAGSIYLIFCISIFIIKAPISLVAEYKFMVIW